MKRRARAVVVLLVLAFFFVAPVMPASSPGAFTGSQVTYTKSPDCYVFGFGPGQGLGIYYDGNLGIGCGPLLT